MQRCGRVHHASCILASWTASRRHTWSPWRAVRHRMGVAAGHLRLLADKLVELEQRARGQLRDILEDPDLTVRAEVARAIDRIG
jgi:hypothetical protein